MTDAVQSGAPPSVGVVIPVFGQGLLAVEALESALEQRGVRPVIVLVDDGCAQPETRAIGLAYAASRSDVSYVRQANGGLSAARNTGVRALLEQHPELPAIYFLDADNRLRPRALERALAALVESGPDVGWIYPDIEMFGLRASWDYGGGYSPLSHRRTNVSEAGSLIRTAVFQAGVRYDETMRSGYEDWDFYLSAAAAGFVGRHLPGFGLQYRKRGESMLTEATRDDAGLKRQLQRKHGEAFGLKTLLALEQQEAPRYAIYLADQGSVRLTTDPGLEGEGVSLDAFAKRYWAAFAAPTREHAPPFIVATTQAALDLLKARRLLQWAFARLERTAEHEAFAFLNLRRGEHGYRVDPVVRGGEGTHARAALAMFSARIAAEVLTDAESGWIDSLTSSTPQPSLAVHELAVAGLARSAIPLPVAHQVGHIINGLRWSPWREGAAVPISWRRSGAPERRAGYRILRDRVGDPGAVVTPIAAGGGGHVGFILPFVSFGGVEKVAVETARSLRKAGFTPHLIVWGEPPFDWTESTAEPFETIHLLDVPDGSGWDLSRVFLGTPLPTSTDPPSHAAALGALGWLDAVVNCHSVGAHALMADLRRLGVRTFAHVHVLDQTPAGQPTGHAMLAVAYEHAYDHVITCSQQLADWLSGMGVPDGKLLAAPNAPGYPLAEAEVERRLAERLRRTEDEPLRALFIGRLDRQKGLDRLVQVVQAAPDCSWRIAGAAVVDGADAQIALENAGVLVEPPATTPEALTALYAWADVFVLLSHWEGLPLTLLEAMRLGCVPIATDVGAVSEAIDDCVDGVLIPNEIAVSATLDALAGLAGDRARLRRLSAAAAARAAARSWDASLEGVVEALNAPKVRRPARAAS